MSVLVSSRFAFTLDHAGSALLQFEAADVPEQELIQTSTNITAGQHLARVPAQDDIGDRIWLEREGRVEVQYEAHVAVNREVLTLEELGTVPPHLLPGAAVKYLFDSRYCHSSEFVDFADGQFGHLVAGERITAIRDWVAQTVRYTSGSSGPSTTATDTFHAEEGICRDFAHLFITLARASTIPARYVACYAPGVTPQDFHAVAEVFLADPGGAGGTWQMVDATGMADLANAVKIGVGRDAADVSFLTSFAPTQFEYSKVEVRLEA